jgi:hypothetical protein
LLSAAGNFTKKKEKKHLRFHFNFQNGFRLVTADPSVAFMEALSIGEMMKPCKLRLEERKGCRRECGGGRYS